MINTLRKTMYSSVNKTEFKISNGFISNLNIIDINRIIDISKEQINKIRYNLALFKLVSFIGVGVYSTILGSGYSKQQYSFDLGITNSEFDVLNNVPDKCAEIGQYINETKVEVRNIQEVINTDDIEQDKQEKPVEEMENDVMEKQEIIDRQADIVNSKYKEAMDILIIREPSYSGMKLSRAYEEKIIEFSNEYGIDPEIMLTYGHQESDGNWNNNGVISITNDYGVFQINECNHEELYRVFGYTSDDLLYDPIKNAEAAAYLIKNIIARSDVNSLDAVFGMYNGWTSWKELPASIDYSNDCLETINKYFPDFQYENNKKLLK